MNPYYPTPEMCDCCGQHFGLVMYDSPTIYGPWGNLCESCFDAYGRPNGHRYERGDDDRFYRKEL